MWSKNPTTQGGAKLFLLHDLPENENRIANNIRRHLTATGVYVAQVLDADGMGVMKKWRLVVHNYVVVTSVDELRQLGDVNDCLKKAGMVVEAQDALGSPVKLGLVHVGVDLNGPIA